ncbi:hypothetical protein F5878DRAFT_665995 [Lentinula raphanica]|uniref:Uncharacterized protein n=1 Tax=Lentinula raphanica TaxID=153919 RepID=A0AA38U663_9AGAR|nr:hypothetical protein F5878DRAFT_665995 [Lentinula raphanica]
MPDPSNPPLPVSRIDSRMRPINKLQSLKRHMKEAQVHVFNHNAIPTFPVSLSRLMSNQFSSAQKSEYRRDGKAKVRNTIQSMMNGTSTSVTIGHGFELWLRKLQGENTSPTVIRNQAEAFLFLIGHQHEDLDFNRLSAGINFCLTYFGNPIKIVMIWRRHATWRTEKLCYPDYLQTTTSELPTLGTLPLNRKRKYEEDRTTDESNEGQHRAIKQRRVTLKGRNSMPATKTLAKNGFDASGVNTLAGAAQMKSDSVKKTALGLRAKIKQAVVDVVKTGPITRSMTRQK